jgi:hypothetical protein
VGRFVALPAFGPSSWTEAKPLRVARFETRVVMVRVLPGQPNTVAYSTVLSSLRVNRMSVLVPSAGVVNEPPPILVGPSPYTVQARVR